MAGGVVEALRLDYYGEQKRYLVVESAQTRDDGTYLLGGLDPGKYYLVALPPEQPRVDDASGERPRVMLQPTYYPFARSADEGISLTVTPGMETRANELTISEGAAYAVCGKAEGVLDKLSDSFSLFLIRQGPESLVFSPQKIVLRSKQDAENHFCFSSVFAGDYSIEFQGFANAPEGKFPVTGSASVSVSTHDLSGVRIQAEPAARLKGLLQVDDSLNRQDAYVKLMAPIPTYDGNQQLISLDPNPNLALLPARAHALDPERATAVPGIQGSVDMRILLDSLDRNVPPLYAQVGGGGRFAVKAVPSGQYRVLAEDLPLGFFVKTVRYQGRDVSSGNLDVAGSPSAQLDIVLSGDAVFIRGTVTDGNGHTVPDATVSLLPASGTQKFSEGRVARTTTTTADGQFAFWNLPPGGYLVWAWQELESPGLATNPSFLHTFGSRAAQIGAVNPADASYVVQVNLVPREEVRRGGWQ